MKLVEETHNGGVVSRIAPNAFVEEPITIIIEGKSTALMLEDARSLVDGLLAAIQTVEEHQSEVKRQEHSFCIGKTKNGMSLIVKSKLGINPVHISRIPFTSNLSQLQGISIEAGKSILDNSNFKIFMKG